MVAAACPCGRVHVINGGGRLNIMLCLINESIFILYGGLYFVVFYVLFGSFIFIVSKPIISHINIS